MGQVIFIRGGREHPMAGHQYLPLFGDVFFIVDMDNQRGTQKIVCVNYHKYFQNYLASEIINRFVGINEPIELVLKDKRGTRITETRFKILGVVEEEQDKSGQVRALIVEVEPF